MTKKEEPSVVPESGQWYNLSLGSSFKDNSSSKFCTLRYEFKPASVDKKQAGTLQKNKENRVCVEFQNNQSGKPKVAFEGCLEDYKENDSVLFFDGVSFRMERLHRAVKQLRHVRTHGDPSSSLPPPQSRVRTPPSAHHVPMQVEVERIDIGANPVTLTPPPPPSDPDVDVVGGGGGDQDEDANGGGNQDDASVEMADDVDVSGGCEPGDGACNAAEALRAQVGAENGGNTRRTSSSSSESSGSESTESDTSDSSSTDTDSNDDDNDDDDDDLKSI